MTSITQEQEYDDRTNYVYKNILRKTSDIVTKKEIEIILEIFDFYQESHKGEYSDDIEDFIILNLAKVDIHRIQRNEIRDVLDAINMYEKSLKEDSPS